MEGGLTQKWHSWALNMRKLTRVDFILVCHLLKNRFSFSHEFFSEADLLQAEGGRDREVSSPLTTVWAGYDRAPPVPSHQDSQAAPSSSVPLSNQLQHLTDGDGLTWDTRKRKTSITFLSHPTKTDAQLKMGFDSILLKFKSFWIL